MVVGWHLLLPGLHRSHKSVAQKSILQKSVPRRELKRVLPQVYCVSYKSFIARMSNQDFLIRVSPQRFWYSIQSGYSGSRAPSCFLQLFSSRLALVWRLSLPFVNKWSCLRKIYSTKLKMPRTSQIPLFSKAVLPKASRRKYYHVRREVAKASQIAVFGMKADRKNVTVATMFWDGMCK